MAQSETRYRKLISELPKHKHAKQAIIASGFSESTATHQAHRVLKSALKYQAKEILKTDKIDDKTSKQLMTDILGVSSGELFDRLKWLAFENNKDVATGYKILSSLATEHGLTLNKDDEAKTINVPVLNLSFGNTANTKPIIENTPKDIEPTV